MARWTLVPARWGRHRVGPVRLRVHAGGGAYVARAAVEVGDLVVYPGGRRPGPGRRPARAGGAARASTRAGRSGPAWSSPGSGRTPTATGSATSTGGSSARHGELFVRQYAAERAFDLVLVLDTAVDAGEPGRSTLDLTVRAATGLAQTYLRSHDRVGLVTFGGPLRWLAPATGPRQLYRVTEALMSVRPDRSELDAGRSRYGLGHLPRGLLPRRAFVALLTPLLDDGPLEAVRLMRERGFAPLVVDVLTAEPDGAAEARRTRRWPCAPGGCSARRCSVELGGLGVAGARLGRRGRAHRRAAARDAGRPSGGPAVTVAAGSPPAARRAVLGTGLARRSRWPRCRTRAGRCWSLAALAAASPRRGGCRSGVAAGRHRRPLLATTVTVLLAGALDASTVRPAQVVLAAGLLMALVVRAGRRRGGPGGRPARSR